jgi:hypothetical protein
MPTCCDQCSHSKGKQNNRFCQGYEDPPPDHDEWDWPDDPHDRGGGKGKGGDGKKGKKSGSHKPPAKQSRQRLGPVERLGQLEQRCPMEDLPHRRVQPST